MTTVKVWGEVGSIKKITVSGHSGYADKGEDIVCAAISSIVQATILGLEKVVKVNLKKTVKDGFVSLALPENISEEKLRESSVLLDTLVISLKSLNRQYPSYIKLEE